MKLFPFAGDFCPLNVFKFDGIFQDGLVSKFFVADSPKVNLFLKILDQLF